MQLEILPLADSELKPKITDSSKLGFGVNFTDRMLLAKFHDGAWQKAVIKKHEPISLSPAAAVFHYGQEIFEGMKAFRQQDGKTISLFRPEDNAARFRKSAERMIMEPVDEGFFVDGIKKLIHLERDWVTKDEGTAMYIRPTLIATHPFLGVKPSSKYIFFVILSPVGPYFATGFNPAKIYVEPVYCRAAPGGTGEAKAGGNYAGSLAAGQNAKKLGYAQVLWLDAIEKKYVEEVGAMNFAAVIDGTVVTAPLEGTVLRGITRDSVLKLAPDLGYEVKERKFSIQELVEGIASGKVTETFGMGTAASITPVGELYYDGKAHTINNFKVGDITQKLYDTLVGIQTGKIEDKYGWNVPIQ